MSFDLDKSEQTYQYYYSKDGNQFGPFNLSSLLKKIDSDTLVWREGIEWTNANMVEELKKFFTSIDNKKTDKIKEEEIKISTLKTTYKKSNTKKIVFAVLIIIFIGVTYVGYYFFLQHHPDWDGKKAAQAFCESIKEDSKSHLKKYDKYKNEFYRSGFKTRNDALNKLNELVNTHDPYIVLMNSNAKSLYNKLRSNYFNDANNLKTFDNFFIVESNICSNPFHQQELNLYNLCYKKVKEIKKIAH